MLINLYLKNTSTREEILNLRLIYVVIIKKYKATYMEFADFEKAFDNVQWCKMFKILRSAN